MFLIFSFGLVNAIRLSHLPFTLLLLFIIFSSFEISTNCLAISSEEMMPRARAQVFLSTTAILSFLTASKLCQTGSSSCFSSLDHFSLVHHDKHASWINI